MKPLLCWAGLCQTWATSDLEDCEVVSPPRDVEDQSLRQLDDITHLEEVEVDLCHGALLHGGPGTGRVGGLVRDVRHVHQGGHLAERGYESRGERGEEEEMEIGHGRGWCPVRTGRRTELF